MLTDSLVVSCGHYSGDLSALTLPSIPVLRCMVGYLQVCSSILLIPSLVSLVMVSLLLFTNFKEMYPIAVLGL